MSDLLILGIIIQIICSIHVITTGRNRLWLWFIIIVPGLGSLVYFIMELLPSLAGTSSSKASTASTKGHNPARAYEQAREDLTQLDSVENQLRLAEAAIEVGKDIEAIAMYEKCLTGQLASDPKIRLKFAKVHFMSGNMPEALKQLEMIAEQNNGYQSQEGHLLCAQALEKLGRYKEAQACYEGQVAHATGEETRARYAMLLLNMGAHGDAKEIFEAIIENVENSPKDYKQTQDEWYRLAKLNS